MKFDPWMFTNRRPSICYHRYRDLLLLNLYSSNTHFIVDKDHMVHLHGMLPDFFGNDRHTVSDSSSAPQHLIWFQFVMMFHVFIKAVCRSSIRFSFVCCLLSQSDAVTQADILVLLSFTILHTQILPHNLLSDPFRVSRILYNNFILLWEL